MCKDTRFHGGTRCHTEPAWHRRKRKARSVARTFLKDFVASPSVRKAHKAQRLVLLLERHHSLPFYSTVRTAIQRLGMSWNSNWNGGYWGGAKRSPKKKKPKTQETDKAQQKDAKSTLPGYDSDKWLSPGALRSSSSSSQPSVMELTKVLRTIVDAGKIEIPQDAKHLLKEQENSETKEEFQREQRELNIRRKAHNKVLRLQGALDTKKEKFKAYKAALRDQLFKETERYEQDVAGLEKAIVEAKHNLERIEQGDLGDMKDAKADMEEIELDLLLDGEEGKEKAKLHAQLASSEKEKQETQAKFEALKNQMKTMEAHYQALVQTVGTPMGSMRNPQGISPVPSQELQGQHSPQLPKPGECRDQPGTPGIGPFSRSSTPRLRAGPYTEKKLPCGTEVQDLSHLE